MFLLRNKIMTGSGLMVLHALSTLSLRSLALWNHLLHSTGLLDVSYIRCSKQISYINLFLSIICSVKLLLMARFVACGVISFYYCN